MTARTGDVIEQARAVIAKTQVPPGVAIADAVARSLHDAGLLQEEPPTRDEIARAIRQATDDGASRTEDYADAILALLEGENR